MTTYRMQRECADNAPALEAFSDHTIFQTPEWSHYLAATQNSEVIVASISNDHGIVGRFTGQIVRKFGARILGSPFPGWMTAYMGFNLMPAVPRLEAVRALIDFAFHDLNCIHIEVMDRQLSVDEVSRSPYQHQVIHTYEVDLSPGKDELLGAMTSACRRNMRKAKRVGLSIEEAHDHSFLDEYYDQLLDVFAKQGLVPTYPKQRVQALLDHLLPTGRLLLLRARAPDGHSIATGIFPAMNDTAFFWGGASHRSHQILRPNEALQWYAMCYWKERGILKYDMGAGSYKRKYGGHRIEVPWIRKSKYHFLEQLRLQAKRSFTLRQWAMGRRHQLHP